MQSNNNIPSSLPDVRIALALLLGYSVALFLVQSWCGLVVFGAALIIVLVAARVSWRSVSACLAPLLFILACTVVAQIPYGIEHGMFYAARIVMLALATLVVAFSYDDVHLVRAFVFYLQPLRRFGAPVDDVASIFSLVLRFIPGCLEEFRRVHAAQESRGARFAQGSFAARVRVHGNVFVPMLAGMFRKASLIAVSMEARCYGASAVRSSLHGNDKLGVCGACKALFGGAACVIVGLLL